MNKNIQKWNQTLLKDSMRQESQKNDTDDSINGSEKNVEGHEVIIENITINVFVSSEIAPVVPASCQYPSYLAAVTGVPVVTKTKENEISLLQNFSNYDVQSPASSDSHQVDVVPTAPLAAETTTRMSTRNTSVAMVSPPTCPRKGTWKV